MVRNPDLFKGNINSKWPGIGLGNSQVAFADTFDIGLYRNAVESQSNFDAPRGAGWFSSPFRKNEDFWARILDGSLVQGDIIELEDFYLLEWLPLSPGKFHTVRAKKNRDQAESQFNGREYKPEGKGSMLLGGVGSVRLATRFLGGNDVHFLGATSNGVSHEGIPVIIPLHAFNKIVNPMRKQGAAKCNLGGRLYSLPLQESPVIFERGMPKYYIYVDYVEKLELDTSDLLVSVAITFCPSLSEWNDTTFAREHGMRNWSFASFNPLEGMAGLQSAVEWFEGYVERYHGRVSSILGDFDELISHFSTPVDFNLSSRLTGVINVEKLNFYGENLNLKIRQETIMGDKIGNIKGETVIIKSTVTNSFNKINEQLGNEAAMILAQVTEAVKTSGNSEAIELMDGFHEELQKSEPKKSILKTFWNGVVTFLPGLISNADKMMDIIEKVTKVLPS